MEPSERFQALPFDYLSSMPGITERNCPRNDDRSIVRRPIVPVVRDREWARWVRNFLLAATILTVIVGVLFIIH